MKRLLIPLLAAIALPPAVNANWFSGDLVWTNSVGEKTIIKKETIRLKKFTVNEKYKNLKNKVLKQRINYDREINNRRRWIKRRKSQYAECFNRTHSKYAYRDYGSLQGICDRKYNHLEIIAYDEAVIEEQKTLKKSYLDKVEPTLLKYKNWNGTGYEVLWTTISYTPIFEDLNRIKTVGYRRTVVCDNPFVDFSSLGIAGGNKGLSSLEGKICKKYAKF
tara:strand:+ start:715 stop:1374 length:660 start_codon:yes stop_codon:yes gene_type:complete